MSFVYKTFSFNKTISFIKKNLVMFISLVLAIVSMFFVPPDSKYFNYIDYKTIVCLFCMLAVVSALKNIQFFYILSKKIVSVFKNIRYCVLALVYITFIGSMLIANDMALITFLPLGYFVLSTTGKEKYMAFTFIMQNIAANLGGMLTPFGNPQNLYLYSKFNIPTNEFISIMFLPFIVSVLLITVCCFFLKPEPLELENTIIKLNVKLTVVYLLLFCFSIIVVFRLIPAWLGLVVVSVTILFLDRKALLNVDYPLLLTFVFFFIFAGNVSRIQVVSDLFTFFLQKNVLLCTVLSCQVISNVPTSILLSQFTTNYQPLLVGVNIGGVGTIVSSLASLITFREYLKHNKGKAKSYLLMFSIYNFAFLIILTIIMLLVLQ